MSQTLVGLYVHIVFSTKHRSPLILPEIESDLFGYLGGIVNNNSSKLLAANAVLDHIHLLVSLYKCLALSDLVGDIKRDSSSWMKSQGDQFSNFYWQDGYGAFSVSSSQIPTVKNYIARQKIKHAKIGFQDEFRALLRKNEIPFDERYVWD